MNSSSTLKPHVVTLGTAGGPSWWNVHDSPTVEVQARAGISTAVVVGSAVYLVDAGSGVGRQLMLAGLPLTALKAVFITHLHSDHVMDLGSLAVFGTFGFGQESRNPIPILGPGDRGALPPVSARARTAPTVLFPADPTPGTTRMFDHLLQAYATDLNDRVLDALRPSPYSYFAPEDIRLPEGSGYHPNSNPSPTMAPFEVYRDELVTVTATLVEHPPVAPAFAFRFDTAAGSVTISGDTAPSENLTQLAAETDLLLHEAIDEGWLLKMYGTDPEQLDDVRRASCEHHRRSHTTPRQAAGIANTAGAKQLALHHLVPGTTPTRVWAEAASDFRGTLHIPDDLTEIPFSSSSIDLP